MFIYTVYLSFNKDILVFGGKISPFQDVFHQKCEMRFAKKSKYFRLFFCLHERYDSGLKHSKVWFHIIGHSIFCICF